MTKKACTFILRIGISITLLLWIFRGVDRKSLVEIIKSADKGLLILGCIIFMLGHIFCLLRWAMLLKLADIRLPFKRIAISFAGGIFFSLFLPSTIGGDLVRSIDLAAHTKKPKQIVATVILDRISGFVGLVLLTLAALLFGGRLVEDRGVLISVSIITGILIAALLVLFNPYVFTKINSFLHRPNSGKIRGAIKNVHQEMYIFRRHGKGLFYNVMLSVGVQLISPITFYIIALAIGVKISIVYFLVFLPIIGAIAMLPISIGGLGLRDATTIYFFAKAGVAANMSLAMSLLNFFYILVYACLGGLVYVLTVSHRRVQPHS